MKLKVMKKIFWQKGVYLFPSAKATQIKFSDWLWFVLVRYRNTATDKPNSAEATIK